MSDKDYYNENIRKAIVENTFSINPTDPNQLLITEDLDIVNIAKYIEQLVRAIENSNTRPYTLCYERQAQGFFKFHMTDLGRMVYIALKNKMATKLTSAFPLHYGNPRLEVFVKHVERGKLEALAEENIWPNIIERNVYDTSCVEIIDKLNQLILDLRSETQARSFTAAVNNFDRLSRKNHKSLVDLIDSIYQMYSRVLVIRVDLSYSQQQYWRVRERTIPYLQAKYLEAKRDREHFFKNMRSNSLFEHSIANAWKLEYAPCKGFHYHFLFFFDGAKVRRDINIAQLIGEYWSKTITNGRGLYYNCNALKEQYQFPGIGMIGHGDTPLKEALINKVAPYLTKIDYYVRMIVPDKGRTFGRSELLEPKTETRGRPRKRGNQG